MDETLIPAPRPPGAPVAKSDRLSRGRAWRRRALWALVALAGIWLLAWLGLPPLLKWQLQKQGSAYLGRQVTVDRVDFRPWSLELAIDGLRIAGAGPDQDLLRVRRVYADAELQSLLRMAPVLDALHIEEPVVRVRHLGQGRYDLDDVLQRLQTPAPEPGPADAARFAIFNIRLSQGAAHFTDDAAGVTHELRELQLTVPFLSNLDSRREVVTQPRLAFVLNGSAFDSAASTTPFARTHGTQARLDVPALDLRPYLAYWPADWPVQPTAGELKLALKLDFEQRETPRAVIAGQVALSGVALAQRLDGQATPWLSFEHLDVELREVEPLARRVALGAVRWQAPELWVDRDARGQLNLQRLLSAWPAPVAATAATSPAATPSVAPAAVPWTLRLERFALAGGRLHWRDASLRPAPQQDLEAFELQADGLQWPALDPRPFQASVRLGSTTLALQGSASDRQANVRLALDQLPLQRVSPYLAQVLEPSLTGQIGATATLDWKAAEGKTPMLLSLGLDRLVVRDLLLGPSRQPLASLGELALEGGTLDLVARAVAVRQLTLTQPRLRAERDAQGRWMVQRWLRAPAAPAAPASTPAVADGPAWSLLLEDVQLNAGQLSLQDALPARPVRLALSGLQVRLRQLRPLDERQQPMPLTLTGRLGGGPAVAEPGRLDFQGQLRLPAARDALLLKGRLQAERLPVHALEPYFGDRLNLELLRADTSYRGTLEVGLPPNGLSLALAGDLAVEDFRANTLSPSEELLAWKALNLRGIDLALQPGRPMRLVVAQTALSDYFARVIISEQGRINLQGLVRDPADSQPAGSATSTVTGTVTAAATTPPAVTSGPRPDIRFGPVSLVNGKVLFSDRFIQPNYSANLSELSGGLSAFSSAPSLTAGGTPQLADLSLRGRAEGTASLEIVGKLNPLAQPLALDIQGRVRDLELPPLSPYSAKYAGYGIERGKLSVDVAYRIAPDGQLNASNQIILNQLAFGDRVAGSDAPNLPVKLAVALLADRNGVIDINLPVSGSLNDPQFRLAPIIFKLIFNLIGKALTAPFSLLASAFGGGGEEMSQITFAPGSAVLGEDSRRRLDAVAKALADRPALQLTVVGHSDLDAERGGYQRARLDALVQAEKRRVLARSGAATNGAVVIAPEEYPVLLKEVYRRADISKPRNLIGMAKDLPVPDMEALLLAAVPVNKDLMRELAVARGVAVKDYLASRELPESRMFLGAPQLAGAGEKWQPQAELKLAPR